MYFQWKFVNTQPGRFSEEGTFHSRFWVLDHFAGYCSKVSTEYNIKFWICMSLSNDGVEQFRWGGFWFSLQLEEKRSLAFRSQDRYTNYEYSEKIIKLSKMTWQMPFGRIINEKIKANFQHIKFWHDSSTNIAHELYFFIWLHSE